VPLIIVSIPHPPMPPVFSFAQYLEGILPLSTPPTSCILLHHHTITFPFASSYIILYASSFISYNYILDCIISCNLLPVSDILNPTDLPLHQSAARAAPGQPDDAGIILLVRLHAPFVDGRRRRCWDALSAARLARHSNGHNCLRCDSHGHGPGEEIARGTRFVDFDVWCPPRWRRRWRGSLVIFRLGSCIFDVILIFLTSVLGTGHFSSSFARSELLLVLKDPQK
jgi:hypothetical protein